MSPGWNQLKQLDELFAVACSGNTTAKRNRSARLPHSVWVEYTLALCVQPCIATTSGEPGGSPLGTYTNILRLPGFVPKLVTCDSVTACAAPPIGASGSAAVHADAIATLHIQAARVMTLRHQQPSAVPGLRGIARDRTAARHALAGRQPGVVLDVIDQQVERALGVRLDQLELRKHTLERLDVVAVL